MTSSQKRGISIEALLNAARVAGPEEDLALQLDLPGSSVLVHKDLEISEPPAPSGSFLTAKGKKWPWDCWDDDRRWAIANAEIEIEVDNFASACMTGLLHRELDVIHLMGLIRIAAVLKDGASERFYYRKAILAPVWTVALARTLQEGQQA
ncbi:hypothetical protein FGADI_5574 [Fusarium gaditjirri]|uniref:Uncharacterized protein n=1 Tax=Fusarium gaditjirri TaxID=282569 RepID=A0A8H4T9X5_9HYPO|nr:hypothetical protein FGADI_5574 [Fusarium gaditjirri]